MDNESEFTNVDYPKGPRAIEVTSPLIPNPEDLYALFKEISSSNRLTNSGPMHQRLERELARHLKVPCLSLFTNGTLPIVSALRMLEVSGEVITTPYSFVATSNAILWAGATPVFVDIDPHTLNIDPAKIEEAITPRTTAILAVHVYGMPCDTRRIQEIADRHRLKVIYDAAHAFGVEEGGKSILTEGDASTLSFHATKVYNTVEGGAVVLNDTDTKARFDALRNFGLSSGSTVITAGINMKMDELRAAFGILNLRTVDDAMRARSRVAKEYRQKLAGIPGLSMLQEKENVKPNHTYFPVLIDAPRFGGTRDDLFDWLLKKGIRCKKYFFPLISQYGIYRRLPSSDPSRLPVATAATQSVICLPLHHKLSEEDVDRTIKAVRAFNEIKSSRE